MSTSSNRSGPVHPRVNSLQRNGRHSRDSSRPVAKRIAPSDAYSYALRVAYLAHLLKPRTRRAQKPPQQPQRASTSINDLMKDFTLLRDSKSTRFPNGFMSELEKRLTGVLIGKEKRQEYNDPVLKRTFAVFFNAFTEQSFHKRMAKDRRVEDLVLIFFSSATKELQKGLAPGDESWKLLVDRHVALFVRLISLTLKDHDWVRDRPELTSRLATLESKLLAHDQDLVSNEGGKVQFETVPLSYNVKDMTLVQTVARIFGKPLSDVQADIDTHKPVWTEQAALQDISAYQHFLGLNTKKSLRDDDFDTEEAYEEWRASEGPDLMQMNLAILQANPELVKSAPAAGLPQYNSSPQAPVPSESGYSELSRKMSDISDQVSSYVIDQPVDMGHVSRRDSDGEMDEPDGQHPFTFIPPDPRGFYRVILMQALSHDLTDQELKAAESSTEDSTPIILLSKESTELLNEACLRWRIPQFSRLVLFLDAIRQKFEDQEVSLEIVDEAFRFIKEPPAESKPSAKAVSSSLLDPNKWTIADFALYRQSLSILHDLLLRDLYELLQEAFDTKAPNIGPILYVLETYIYEDPLFSKNPEDLDQFSIQLEDSLRAKASVVYGQLLEKEVPGSQDQWEFFHVIQLGRAWIKLAEKIQKRYRRNPEIMGVNLFNIFIETTLPSYGEDARDMITRILDIVRSTGEEVSVEDGFELYKEMVEIRRIHRDAIPDVRFPFHIEGLLEEFVWRWIQATDEKIVGWVEQAVKQDLFQVRTSRPDQVPSDDERHSVSVIDIFGSFNQAVDQIVQLEWDDDFQYAKFMTALSRSIGVGITRYCDVIEQKFSKEMDILTPEQEAAASLSRQERWMQMAKDAWNNKEKIEPFQFVPQSLVKLNNIEYAILQLDKLEKNINIDACADVINRHTPQSTVRQRRINNFVFTIKIVEAEDLKACDMNGLSDPYVVLGDEYQKRLAKTRIVYGNLNPRWDESIDITTQGPLNIIATVWDWDAVGDHDCVGRTSIKLDPSHFGDFLPREYWLDLDTQGRLLLRVSMEGERDDIQFYFGKAFRTLKRAERDMTRKITDKLSSYIHHCLSKRALRSLLSRGITMSSVSNIFNRNRVSMPQQGPTKIEIMNALRPLFVYFDDNFALMKQTLTDSAMITVMTRLWKEVLVTIESLLVPPLSDKPSQQRQLTQQELDIVFHWLKLLFDFFHAVEDETGEAHGVPIDVLKSPKYHDIQSLNFFYFESTDNLVRTSERMASATASRQQAQRNNRLSAPASLAGPSFGGAIGLMGMTSTRRSKSIMLSRNLGTMKKAKEERRKEAQADPNDDMILRILRMRPEAERYLRDRSRQKERLAAAAAAEMIVRQSLASRAGGGFGNRILPRR
ncbi:hypothetical protein L228DRAFT_230431 [Xylona heveae TC161]|uniref:C2 domain protein n=1 Tax=Xylona heveae (strain CBS 132557 / TC161) TaxID=1328760 RepID=A0A165GEQ6_XYLHT|nr:hypothetical protein L228DRAFT_230431 [Xylona heveae TC161]KZF22099.1 hypothetical protein L228DRAFT_230431 [Xylona heveae TC161]